TGRRWFCGTCGTALLFEEVGERRSLGVTLASLDDPAALQPRQHAWIGSRIPWLPIDETLPAYADDGPAAGGCRRARAARRRSGAARLRAVAGDAAGAGRAGTGDGTVARSCASSTSTAASASRICDSLRSWVTFRPKM